MRHITFAACATLLLAACAPQFKVPEMTPEETRRIEQLTERMTTRCVGRYLIDLPESFVLSVSNPAVIEEISVTVTPMSRSAFDYKLELRTQELQKEHMDGKPDKPFLRRLEKTPQEFIGNIFNRANNPGTAGIGRVLELHAWRDSYLIRMDIEATDYPGAGFHRPDDPLNDTPHKLAQLLSVYDRIEGRKENEIPEGKGLCIANGFVRGAPMIEEGLSTSFDLKGAPDVSFDFAEHGNLHEQDSMLQRSSEIDKEMKKSGTQTIRKGKNEISGKHYEEWLTHGPTPDHVPGTMFILNADEVAEGADKPFISLQLLNGFRIMTLPDLTDEQKERLGLYRDLEHATFSPAEAVALWDKVIPTLRKRPGAF